MSGEEKKFCKKCGKQVDAEVKFCPFCGSEIETNEVSKTEDLMSNSPTENFDSVGNMDAKDDSAEKSHKFFRLESMMV